MGLIRSESESDAWQGPHSHQQDLCELELVPREGKHLLMRLPGGRQVRGEWSPE